MTMSCVQMCIRDRFNSDSVRMMQGFYDDELCNTLAQQHGIGIAAMIVKQLSPKHK